MAQIVIFFFHRPLLPQKFSIEFPRNFCSNRLYKEVTLSITLSARAIAKAEELRRSSNKPSLRLYLEGKGCDGFYYGVAFDQPTPNDHHFPQGKVDVIVDADSLRFVTGSTIDWVDDQRGCGFLVDNPAHKKYRGKFYKKSYWRGQLMPKQKDNL